MADVQQTIAERLAANQGRSKRLVRGPDGQLQEMTGEDIQSISADQDQQIPTSPMQAAVLGASPDSAKMIGDARQKRAALDINQQTAPQTETLADRLRTKQAGDTAVATRGQLPISENLAKLGSLGTRVHSVINSYVAKSLENKPVIVADEGINTALAAYNANATPENEAAFRAASGGISPQEYIQSKSAGDTATQQLQAATPNQFNMSELGLVGTGPDAPFATEEDLAAALGVDVAALGSMSLTDLQQNIQAQVDNQTQDMEQWTSRATDPNLGPAERAEARQQLRDMGAIGVRANEEQWNQLGAELDAADEIQFGGQAYTVDELLSDDGISGLVSDYLNNPARAAELSKSEPELTAWIESHKSALQDASEQLADSAEKQYKTTTANQEIAQGLPPEVMSNLLPGYNPESGVPVDLATAPAAVQLLNDPAHIASLTGILGQYPDLAGELSGMSEADIRASGILEPTSDRWQSYIAARTSYKQLQAAGTTEELIDAVFGVDTDQADVDRVLKQAYSSKKSGLGNPYEDNKTLKLLDPDMDGVIGSKSDSDTLGVLKGHILGGKLGFGSSEIPRLGSEVKNPMESLRGSITPTDSSFSRMSDILGKGMMSKDGKSLDLNEKEIGKLAKKATVEDLLLLQDKGSGMDKKEKKQLAEVIQDRISSELSSMYKDSKFKPASIEKMDNKQLKIAKMDIEDMIAKAKADGKKYLIPELKKQLEVVDDTSKSNKKKADSRSKLENQLAAAETTWRNELAKNATISDKTKRKKADSATNTTYATTKSEIEKKLGEL